MIVNNNVKVINKTSNRIGSLERGVLWMCVDMLRSVMEREEHFFACVMELQDRILVTT